MWSAWYGIDSTVKRSTEHWFLVLSAAATVLGLLAVAVFLEPDPRGYGTHEKLGFAPCLPMELWEIPCPGCGKRMDGARLKGEAINVCFACGTAWFDPGEQAPFRELARRS